MRFFAFKMYLVDNKTFISSMSSEVRTMLNKKKSDYSTVNSYLPLFWGGGDRERQSTSGGGAESKGDTESEAGYRFRAVSTEPNAGLEPTNREILSSAEVGHLTD